MTVEEMQAQLDEANAKLLEQQELARIKSEELEAERIEKLNIKKLADETSKNALTMKEMLDLKDSELDNTRKELEQITTLANGNSEVAEKLKAQQEENVKLQIKKLQDENNRLQLENAKIAKESEKETARIIKEGNELKLKLEAEAQFKQKKTDLLLEKAENKILIKDLQMAETEEEMLKVLSKWDNEETLNMVKMTNSAGSNVFANRDSNIGGQGEISLRESLRASLKNKNAK